jgi:hypothetical protein
VVTNSDPHPAFTVMLTRVLTVTKEIIFACILGVILLLVFAASCWDIVERRRLRRRERELELELQERLWGAAVGAEVAGARGGSPG